jgi:hypothetical protein
VKRTQPDGLGCIQVGYYIDFTPIEAKRDGFLVSADADRTIEEAKTVKISAAGS